MTPLSNGSIISESIPCDTLAIVPSSTATVYHPWSILLCNANPMNRWNRSCYKLYRYHTPRRIPCTTSHPPHVARRDCLLPPDENPFITCLPPHTLSWIPYYSSHHSRYHDPDYEITSSEYHEYYGLINDRDEQICQWLEERHKLAGKQKTNQ